MPPDARTETTPPGANITTEVPRTSSSPVRQRVKRSAACRSRAAPMSTAVAARLRSAQPGWQEMGVDARARWMSKWRDWILDHGDELLGLVQRNPASHGVMRISRSWPPTSPTIGSSTPASFSRTRHVRPAGPSNIAKRLTIVYEAYQLVGVITPWNYPLAMPLLDIAPALMAGCAVVSKPSELTPLAWRGWSRDGSKSAPPMCWTSCSAPAKPARR